MQDISETRRSTLESATAAPAHADSETQYQEQTMNEPCLCGALDCRACRGSDAYDPDADDDTQRKGMSLVLGREVTSRADLSEDDAHAVIAALQAELDRRDTAQTGGE